MTFVLSAFVVFIAFADFKSYCQKHENFTVMTFNIWLSGINVENGTQKIAAHIKWMNPDIVALQEVVTSEFLTNLTALMGDEWEAVTSKETYPDNAILTRHKIVHESLSEISHGIGTKILIESINRTVHFWGLHLDYRSYGPYAAFNKMVTKYGQIIAGEMADGHGRFQNMRELILDEHFQEALKNYKEIPIIVCGDFNAPSHLDWTSSTKQLHGDWDFEWPATKILQSEALMVDSFRELHPNVLENPGITWSTVEKMSSSGWAYTIPEPQDRIDFIFYRSPLLKPVQSYTYQGHKVVYPKPYHFKNDYPSDHFAVITTFFLQ